LLYPRHTGVGPGILKEDHMRKTLYAIAFVTSIFAFTYCNHVSDEYSPDDLITEIDSVEEEEAGEFPLFTLKVAA